MALKDCRECGKSVSSKAPSCPHCGAQLKRKGIGCGSVVGFFFLMVTIAWAFSHVKEAVDNPNPAIQQSETKPNDIDLYDKSVCQAYQDQTAQSDCLAELKLAHKQADVAACLESIDCVIDRAHVEAEAVCPRMIEAAVLNGVRWNDGFLGFKFPYNPSRVGDSTVVRFRGDKAEYQNRFGAWFGLSYNCDIDMMNIKVVDVQVVEGS